MPSSPKETKFGVCVVGTTEELATDVGLEVVAVGAIEDVVKVSIAANADVVIAGIVDVLAVASVDVLADSNVDVVIAGIVDIVGVANVDVLADSNVDVAIGVITVAGDEELADTIDTVDEADGISVTDWKLLYVCRINCLDDGSTSFDS